MSKWDHIGGSTNAQLDLFAPRQDWTFVVEHHEFTAKTSAKAVLAGRYAGSAHLDAKTGLWAAWISLGWRISSPTAFGTRQEFLGEFDSVHAAEQALEKAARAAQRDQSLIWENALTKATIKQAKTNGWWKRSAA